MFKEKSIIKSLCYKTLQVAKQSWSFNYYFVFLIKNLFYITKNFESKISHNENIKINELFYNLIRILYFFLSGITSLLYE